VKCPQWKRINAERWRIFEGPRRPALTEAQKTLARKREELARVLEPGHPYHDGAKKSHRDPLIGEMRDILRLALGG
jgi:hypothetical protein